MTIKSTMKEPSKSLPECPPTPKQLTRAEIRAIVEASAPPRYRPRRRSSNAPILPEQPLPSRCSMRSSTSLVAFICIVLAFDALSLLSVDAECPGPFTHFTGLQPTFHLCMAMALHMITLVCALSRTVNGCRVAMAIAWLFFMLSVGLLIFTPAFVGSYVASGIAPTVDKLAKQQQQKPATATERFYSGFFLAIGGQFFVFIVFLAAIFQMTLIADLLHQAHIFEDPRLPNDYEEALVMPPQPQPPI